jgi:plastocyanin
MMRSSFNPRGLCAVAVAALALGLAACGDDDDETADTGTGTGTQQEQPAPPPEEPASETVTITETEFAIEPADVKVAKPGVVEFRVENAGGIPHALEIESEDLEEETEDIAPGESATLRVDLPAGTYELYCPIGNHEDQGMTGTLTVGGGGGATTDDSDDSGRKDDSGGAEAPSGDDSGGAEAPPSGDDGPGY